MLKSIRGVPSVIRSSNVGRQSIPPLTGAPPAASLKIGPTLVPRRSAICLALVLGLVGCAAAAPVSGRHLIYAQYDFVFTFEFTTRNEPILNIVNFTDQTLPLRAQNILLVDDQGREVKVDRIILETGNPSDPYLTPIMKILPNSFIGLVLKGKFDAVKEFKSVAVQLGNTLFHLDPVSSPAFDGAVEKINRMNFDSPDVREDFRVVKMDFLGRKEPAPAPRKP